MNKFLQSITTMGNDVLIPINRIKYVNLISSEEVYEIRITGDDGCWIEFFNEGTLATYRYHEIKRILNDEQEKEESSENE